MSADGRIVAVAARRGTEQYCVVNDRRGPPHRVVFPPVVAGGTVAYAAEDDRGAFIVHGGAAGPRYRWVGHAALSPDGRRVAYVAERGVGDYVVVGGGVEGPSFDRISSPVFSADGRAVAYGARRRGEWRVVCGGREMAAPGEIARVFLSDDGSRLGAVVAEGGRAFVVADGSRGPVYDWIGWSAFAGGRPVYFAARGPVKRLVAGSREVELGEWTLWDPELSADGARVAFGACIGRELWRRVVAVPPE
jgi:hypothetical protein